MLRTQIYLPERQIRSLKKRAVEENVSVSEVVRRAVDQELLNRGRAKSEKLAKNAGESLLGLARKFERMGVKGPRDLAENMDKYLYDKDFR